MADAVGRIVGRLEMAVRRCSASRNCRCTVPTSAWASHLLVIRRSAHTAACSSLPSCKTHTRLSEATDSEWQWHQLGHMQVCILLQTDKHASTSPLSVYRLDALPAAQPTVSKHRSQFKALKACATKAV